MSVALVEFTGEGRADIDWPIGAAALIFGKRASWCDQFIEMNDKKLMSFVEIAQEIRKMAKEA